MLIVFSESLGESSAVAERGAEEFFRIMCENKKLAYAHTADGKPFFKERNGKRSPLNVSVSHGGKYIFAALSFSGCGIDVQFHDEKTDAALVSKRIFGREILDRKEFFDAWAQGEAYIKLTGLSALEGFSAWERGEKWTKLLPLFEAYSVAYACENPDEPVFILELL